MTNMHTSDEPTTAAAAPTTVVGTHTHRSWADKAHTPIVAWSVLFVSLLLTVMAWAIADRYVTQRAQERFQFEVSEAEKAIQKRMLEYEQVLRGGVGLFAAVGKMASRQEWRSYVQTLEIDKYFPGIQGVGFSYWLPVGERTRLVDAIRAEGFPEFNIKPEGERDQLTSIIYLEPFSGRNLRAFGFDMYSEPTRRAAMQRARDSGLPAVSGRVTLVQETLKDVQAGFLMYLPVYRASMPTRTVDERRAALLGFVYSPFRIKDLMRGILGSGSDALDFEIFDERELDKDHLLFDSNEELSINAQQLNHDFYAIRSLILPGRQWTATFSGHPDFQRSLSSNEPAFVAIGGLAVDILLFSIILSLAARHKQVERRAAAITSQLANSEQRFRRVVESAPVAMLMVDANGRIQMTNHATEHMFGYESATLIGQPVETLVPSDSRAVHQTSRSVFVQNPTSRTMGENRRLYGQHRDGHTIPIEVGLNPLETPDGLFILASIIDISKRLEVDRLKSEFIATVSHELRTPLTSIRGSLGLVAGGAFGALPDQVVHMTDVAVQNADRLIRLINDILDIEKIESGKMRYDIRAQDLSYLVGRAVEETHGFAKQLGVVAVIDNHCQWPLIAAVDADRFTQVLTNLLSNACKFSPAGEPVTVCIEASDDDKVRIGVRDRGHGIPEEFNDRIFQKFAQADGSNTRKHAGTGLGLSISKAIVEHFNGRIWFESRLGEGTTFYVELPLVTTPR